MAQSSQFDVYELRTLAIPYWLGRRPLDEDPPVIVDGSNVMSTLGGRMLKRFGTADMVVGDPQNLPVTAGRIERLFPFEGEPVSGVYPRYIVASVFSRQNGRWRLRYICLNPPGNAVPVWQDVPGNVNNINLSTRAHEAVAARGRLYVRGVPAAASGVKFCGVVLSADPANYTNLRVDYWGLPDPQEPARIAGAVTRITAAVDADDTTFTVESSSGFPSPPFTAIIGFEEVRVTAVSGNSWTVQRGYNDTEPGRHAAYTPVLWRDFATSQSDVQTVIGWQYSYAYKSRTGHVSSRAPVATEVRSLPSATGPFRALCPKIRVPSHPDPTLVPKIVIYRTTDGGGVFYRLAEIDNPGSGMVEYIDDDGETGIAMPVPDATLSGGPVAPSLTSNSPPPPVASPKVMGVDAPEPSTPLALYANRIWFGIGNTLFYSALEENQSGVPEESFPSGVSGNYFRMLEPIVSVVAGPECLFVFSSSNIYQITGSTRETFSMRLFASNVGMHNGFPRGVTAYRDTVFFLSSAHHICAITGDRVRVISYPNYANFEGLIPGSHNVEIHAVNMRDYELLFVLCGYVYGWNSNVSGPTQHVYDFNLSQVYRLDFWNPVWDIPAVAGCRSKTRMIDQEMLVLANYHYEEDKSILVTLSPHSGYDLLPDGSLRPVAARFLLSPIRCPAGNHLNLLRVPIQYPVLHSVTLVWRVMEPTDLPGWKAHSTYVEPRLYYVLDELAPHFEPIPFGTLGKPGGWQTGWTYDWGKTPQYTYSDYPMKRPTHVSARETYVEAVHHIDRAARRVMVGVELPESGSRMEINAIQIAWLPTSGI